MQPIIIAIDGPSSSGKSTIAKYLASVLRYRYIDSGAFYRAITVYFHRHKTDVSQIGNVKTALQAINIDFEFDFQTGESKTLLNGENVEPIIRGIEISNLVSEVSAIPEVRSFVVSKLREYGKHKAIVMDGRDIGTVVFPDAALKIYMTADEKVRSERRFKEMKKKGADVTESQITKNLSGRDLLDSTRPSDPLKKAGDAVEFDNTRLSKEESFEQMLLLARKRIAAAQ